MKAKEFIKKYQCDDFDDQNVVDRFVADLVQEFQSVLEYFKMSSNFNTSHFDKAMDLMCGKFEAISNKLFISDSIYQDFRYIANSLYESIYPEIKLLHEKISTASDVELIHYYHKLVYSKNLDRKVNGVYFSCGFSYYQHGDDTVTTHGVCDYKDFKSDRFVFVSTVNQEFDNLFDDCIENYRKQIDDFIDINNLNRTQIFILDQIEKRVIKDWNTNYFKNRNKHNREKEQYENWIKEEKRKEQERKQFFEYFWSNLLKKNRLQQYNSSDLVNLGLSNDFDESTLKKNYRLAAMKNHPDKGGNAEEFIKIKQSYDRCLLKFSNNN